MQPLFDENTFFLLRYVDAAVQEATYLGTNNLNEFSVDYEKALNRGVQDIETAVDGSLSGPAGFSDPLYRASFASAATQNFMDNRYVNLQLEMITR